MIEKPTAKTFRCGNAVRWRQPNERESAPVLQQVWECLETGGIEWRDVPIEPRGGIDRRPRKERA